MRAFVEDNIFAYTTLLGLFVGNSERVRLDCSKLADAKEKKDALRYTADVLCLFAGIDRGSVHTDARGNVICQVGVNGESEAAHHPGGKCLEPGSLLKWLRAFEREVTTALPKNRGTRTQEEAAKDAKDDARVKRVTRRTLQGQHVLGHLQGGFTPMERLVTLFDKDIYDLNGDVHIKEISDGGLHEFHGNIERELQQPKHVAVDQSVATRKRMEGKIVALYVKSIARAFVLLSLVMLGAHDSGT